MAFVTPIAVPSVIGQSKTSICFHERIHRLQKHSPRPAYIYTSSSPVATATNKTDSIETTSNEAPLSPPPSTFYQAITQAQSAVDAGLADGFKLLEIEFPPLPTADLESSAVGAYDVSDANVRLAVDFAKKYARGGKRVSICFPDLIEKDRAVEQNNESEEPIEGIRFGSLRDERKGAFLERIWTKPELDIAVRENDDMFVVLGASCQELPDVERLVAKAGDRPVILFNLKLDTSRGDLGLPAFPRKDLHFRFLSKVLPVYYLRTRTYSRSITRAPYIVNYSGALYRVYPGKYQVLLDTEKGNYERLSALDERPALGRVRDILTDGLNIDSLKGKEGSMLYKGYKSETWWEQDRTKATSDNWRS